VDYFSLMLVRGLFLFNACPLTSTIVLPPPVVVFFIVCYCSKSGSGRLATSMFDVHRFKEFAAQIAGELFQKLIISCP
jgi:hypothetical protein